MKDQLIQVIDELNAEYVKIWEDICNIESPWSFKEGVDAVGEYFIRYANERGWKTEVFEQGRAASTSGFMVRMTTFPARSCSKTSVFQPRSFA